MSVLFNELKLSPEILRAITEMGFEKATNIQSSTIPALLSGRDIMGRSETGSGKTAAFAIPLLERIDPKIRKPQALVLCPTRELAVQVAGECTRLMAYKKGMRVLPIYGGQAIEHQFDMLRRGVHIVIGTPGRLIDHLERKTLSLDSVTMVVLDEADEMLDMGFTDDINKILDSVPQKPQMIFFSATFPDDMRVMMKKYLHEPHIVTIENKTMTVESTQQHYYDVDHFQKPEILCRLLDIHQVKRGLIFCNTKKMVDDLVLQLQTRGYDADGIHGDLNQAARDRVMNAFRKGRVQLLVATDVAARGIDVQDIEIVINYDIPKDEEDYVHRIGRTGRAGKSGLAVSLVCGRDVYKLKSIERFARVRIHRQRTPSSNDALESVRERFSETIRATIVKGHSAPYIDMVEAICGEDHTAMDVAAALLKMHAPLQAPQQPPIVKAAPGPVHRNRNERRREQFAARRRDDPRSSHKKNSPQKSVAPGKTG